MRYVAPLLAIPLIALLALDAEAQQPAGVRTLTPVRDYRVDASNADLSRVGMLLVTKSGEIALSQGNDRLIRFFDASGRGTTFGRAGDGPGEFRTSWHMGFVGDTLWVTDPTLRRLTLLTGERKILRVVRHPTTVTEAGKASETGMRFSGIFVAGMYRDGSLLVRVILPPDGAAQPAWASGSRGSITALLHTSVEGEIRRLVAWVPPRPSCGVQFTTASGIGNAMIPFCRPFLDAVAEDADLVAFITYGTVPQPSSYTLTVIRAGGDTAFTREYRYDAIAIPKRVADSVINLRVEEYRNRPEFVAAYRNLQVPATYPPLSSMFIGRDNTIWLESYPTGNERLWQIVDVRGNLVARASFPANVTIMAADLQAAWGLETDADGLQGIVRYRLQGVR